MRSCPAGKGRNRRRSLDWLFPADPGKGMTAVKNVKKSAWQTWKGGSRMERFYRQVVKHPRTVIAVFMGMLAVSLLLSPLVRTETVRYFL